MARRPASMPFWQVRGVRPMHLGGYMATLARMLNPSTKVESIERLRAEPDSAVVSAFLGGEERAFSVLVERYQARLSNFIYRTIGDREKAEDLVQEVFI